MIKDKEGKESLIQADKIIIATGSEPVALPNAEFDETIILSSTGALNLNQVPKKWLLLEEVILD